MIGIIGFGSWGTALSIACSHNKAHLIVWVRNKKQKYFFKKFFFNIHYTKKLKLKNNITLTMDNRVFFSKIDIVILAIPSFILKNIIKKICHEIKLHHKLVISCKGFFKGIFFHKIIINKLKSKNIAVLTGPSFANEIAKKKNTSISLSSNNKFLLLDLLDSFHSRFFKVYCCNDLVGLQFSSIYKNILAFLSGMIASLNFGENARAVLITYGLSEFKRFIIYINAKKSTLFTLGSIGDIVLTCTSKKSRNYDLGVFLGLGHNAKFLKLFLKKTVESTNNITCLLFLSKKYNVSFLIPQATKNVILNKNSCLTCVKNIIY